MHNLIPPMIIIHLWYSSLMVEVFSLSSSSFTLSANPHKSSSINTPCWSELTFDLLRLSDILILIPLPIWKSRIYLLLSWQPMRSTDLISLPTWKYEFLLLPSWQSMRSSIDLFGLPTWQTELSSLPIWKFMRSSDDLPSSSLRVIPTCGSQM